jgi:hypothetical protein
MMMPAMLAAALATAGVAAESPELAGPAAAIIEQQAVQTPALPTPPPAVPTATLPKGTLVRLMVLNEVNSRDHKAGHRFVLRVDEEVKAGPFTVIPIGAKAWGEVVEATKTGGAGKSGRLNARLLYVEGAGQQLKLDGARHNAGGSATGQVVVGVLVWGPFGLLMKGNNATLKAGEILNGYTLEDQSFPLSKIAAKP